MTMEVLADWVSRISNVVWNGLLLYLLVGTGIVFTIRTRFIQVRKFGAGWKHLFGHFSLNGEKAGKDGMSPFQALTTAIAAQVGTGNIAGAATALYSGGPGAIFWMWLSAFFGMSTIYGEAVLAQKYKTTDDKGHVTGGPIYYIRARFQGGFGKFLAGFFSVAIIFALGFTGNMVQANSISVAFKTAFGAPQIVVGVVCAIIAAFIFLGGVGRIASVTEKVVPIMALFYMGGAVIVLWVHRAALPQAFAQICSMAFDTRAGTGGVLGYGMTQAVRAGVSRGIFSNEAGLGSSVMVHAAADAREPCEQGMWAVFEVFFDTIVMCSVTAFVILTSGVYDVSRYALASGTPLISQLTTGAQLTAEAFSTVFGRFGGGFVAVSLALFAFSTLLGWSYYGQRAAAYLMGERVIPVYKAAFLLAAVAGCMMRLEPVWALSDTFNGLMALPNLAGVLALRRQVIAEWCRYKHDL